jgi:pseudouridylate synthase
VLDRDAPAALEVSEEVQAALAARRGVVALESAVLTHGLPIGPALEAVARQRRACAGEGATAAVVGVLKGRLVVGLSDAECAELARHPDRGKASGWNLAALISAPGYAGTTVAATVRAAWLAGIGVVATGGLGGVHRGPGLDVSADLAELAARPVCVVCSGPKSILDVEATVERLETLAIPLVGWRSDRVAGFLSPLTEIPVAARVDSLPELVALVRGHLRLGGCGVVVSRPLDAERAVSHKAMLRALDSLGEAERGGWRTPADLERLRAALGPVAIEANLALLEANAGLAAGLAVGLAA